MRKPFPPNPEIFRISAAKATTASAPIHIVARSCAFFAKETSSETNSPYPRRGNLLVAVFLYPNTYFDVSGLDPPPAQYIAQSALLDWLIG